MSSTFTYEASYFSIIRVTHIDPYNSIQGNGISLDWAYTWSFTWPLSDDHFANPRKADQDLHENPNFRHACM